MSALARRVARARRFPRTDARKPRRGRQVRLPPVRYPRHLERSYERYLLDRVEGLEAILRRKLDPVLDRLSGDIDQRYEERVHRNRSEGQKERHGDSAATDSRALIGVVESVRIEWGKKRPVADVAKKLEAVARGVDSHSRDQLKRQVERVVGVDVFQDPGAAAVYRGFTTENAKLITSLADEHLDQVAQQVRTAIESGQSTRALRKDIQERYGVARSRAQLIARDQLGTLNGQITEYRQREIGATKYIWDSSGDERVRPLHVELDSTVQKWDDPPESGTDGEHEHPGRPINCRCVAQVILDDDNIQELEEAAAERKSVMMMRREKGGTSRRTTTTKRAPTRTPTPPPVRREPPPVAETAPAPAPAPAPVPVPPVVAPPSTVPAPGPAAYTNKLNPGQSTQVAAVERKAGLPPGTANVSTEDARDIATGIPDWTRPNTARPLTEKEAARLAPEIASIMEDFPDLQGVRYITSEPSDPMNPWRGFYRHDQHAVVLNRAQLEDVSFAPFTTKAIRHETGHALDGVWHATGSTHAGRNTGAVRHVAGVGKPWWNIARPWATPEDIDRGRRKFLNRQKVLPTAVSDKLVIDGSKRPTEVISDARRLLRAQGMGAAEVDETMGKAEKIIGRMFSSGRYRYEPSLDGSAAYAARHKKSFVNRYARTNPSEDFAETFDAYRRDPDGFKATNPRTWQVFEERKK